MKKVIRAGLVILAITGMGTACQPGKEGVIDEVDFLLWTYNVKSSGRYEKFRLDSTFATRIKNSNFDPTKPIKILVHGYDDNGLTAWVKSTKNALLSKGEFNVFSVDWKNLAKAPFYPLAVSNIQKVGPLVAYFVKLLVELFSDVTFNSFHLIGFSLGAHLIGISGYHLNGQIPRITGLDPAGPFFHEVPKSQRLDKSDAQFVDVIHSAGLWISLEEQIGHVDFYPNGGFAHQPGCNDGFALICSHFRAHEYFTESITSSTGFKSWQCTDLKKFKRGECDKNPTNLMGFPAIKNQEGAFYLKTHSHPPYAIPELT